MTTTTQKQKWFFPAQEKIKTYLKNKYGENYRCEFQDICKYTAYETYQCWKPKEPGKPQEQQRITFVIHRHITARQGAPAIIEVQYSKLDDTMQYFVEPKTKK